jgi:hypothetical protein
MRIKVTKRQFLLLLDNLHILSRKGLSIETTVGTLNSILDSDIPTIDYSYSVA